MPRGGLSFKITPFRANDLTKQYANELRDRMAVVRQMVVRSASEEALEIVKDELPPDEKLDQIQESLIVKDVEGLKPDTEAASAIVMKAANLGRRLRDLPQDRTLLVVQTPNPRIQPAPEQIFILRRHNPWTVDTIPFVPKRSIARTVSRVVSKGEAEKIRKLRQESLPKVLQKLTSIGIRLSLEDLQRLKETAAVEEVVTDLALASLRAEFGLPGYKSSPHWRPALRVINNVFPKRFFSRKDVWKILNDPEFTGWKTLLKVIDTIGTKEVEKLTDFQNKVKVR